MGTHQDLCSPFLNLPAELRLQIYSWIDGLGQGTPVYITLARSKPLTPAICRTNRLLRRETIPIYASSSAFNVDISSLTETGRQRVGVWLAGLGSELKKVNDIKFSRAWDISHPTRGCGHVGFYLNLTRSDPRKAGIDRHVTVNGSPWVCERGTYPVFRDKRGMRFESVDLLHLFVLACVHSREGRPGWCSVAGEESGSMGSSFQLRHGDIELIISLMDVVAAHAIPLYDTGTSAGRHRVWENMQRSLRLVSGLSVGEDGESFAP